MPLALLIIRFVAHAGKMSGQQPPFSLCPQLARKYHSGRSHLEFSFIPHAIVLLFYQTTNF
jgi:hypothetical protein